MKIIQQNKGASVGETTYGKYVMSEAGSAIGQIPGWGAFYDAEYYETGETSILNRVNGTKTPLSSATFTKITDGGQQYLRRVRANPQSVAHVGDFDLGQEFTFFVVAKLTAETTNIAGNAFRLARRIQETTERSLHITVTNTRSRARQLLNSTATSNSIVELNLFDIGLGDEVAILVYTYNNGSVTIRANGGNMVSGNSAPITSGLNAGDWDWFRNANGEFGAWGALNIDLSLPANSAYLADLEGYFINKYGIRRI